MENRDQDPPFEGGSQPVPERVSDTPGPGRSTLQVVVIVVAVLVLLAAVLWLVVPFGAN